MITQAQQTVVVAADLPVSLKSLPVFLLIVFLSHVLHYFNAHEPLSLGSVVVNEFLMLEDHAVKNILIIVLKVLVNSLMPLIEGACDRFIPKYPKVTAYILRVLKGLISLSIHLQAVQQAVLECVIGFISERELAYSLVAVIALLILYKFDLVRENKALEGLIWVNTQVLVLLFFSKIK